MTAKVHVPWWRWSLWMGIFAAALVLFYGILTPVWMLIRLVAWLSEHPAVRGRPRASES